MNSFGVHHWYQSGHFSDRLSHWIPNVIPAKFPATGDSPEARGTTSELAAGQGEIGDILNELGRHLPDIKQCRTELSTVFGEISEIRRRLKNINRSLTTMAEKLPALKSELILSGEVGVERNESVQIRAASVRFDLTTVVPDSEDPRRRHRSFSKSTKKKKTCTIKQQKKKIKLKLFTFIANQKKIEIFMKILTGKTKPLEFDSLTILADLKNKIQGKARIPPWPPPSKSHRGLEGTRRKNQEANRRERGIKGAKRGDRVLGERGAGVDVAALVAARAVWGQVPQIPSSRTWRGRSRRERNGAQLFENDEIGTATKKLPVLERPEPAVLQLLGPRVGFESGHPVKKKLKVVVVGSGREATMRESCLRRQPMTKNYDDGDSEFHVVGVVAENCCVSCRN